MAKSKLNFDDFNRFDLNDACDYFDCESQAQWKKIGKFIVADGQEYQTVMEDEFNFEDTTSHEYEAFDAGVRYAFTKLNAALEAAGVELEITSVDLVESMGFMLTRVDDTPEDFVKRVLKKPVMMVDSWV
jgi:hypothetical protein